MSGRSRYRKGHHPLLGRFGKPAGPRRLPDQMPPWRLVITLPTQLFAVSPGPTGIIGVTVNEARQVVAEGRDWEWVYKQAAAFLAIIAKGYDGALPPGEISRGAEPALAISNPPAHPPIRRVQRLVIVSKPSVIFLRERREPMIFAA